MALKFLFLVSRQGRIRLSKWYIPEWTQKEKTKSIREISQLVISRKPKMCSALEYKDFKVIYRRYASLYFIAGTDLEDNELLTIEIIHRYVEILDDWFLSVCELDIVYNFSQAYVILDEFILGGEVQEHSKKKIKEVLKCLQDASERDVA